nr:DUF3575 domain-containing protein [uncultured Alistipes sp.]
MSVRKIFLSVICLSCFLSAHAGQGADSVRIYYRTGYRYVEPAYRDNSMQLARFTESARRALRAGTIERVVVRSGTSPDGTNKANELLSERRADSLVSYIVRHADVPPSLVEKQAAGILWDELRAQVAASGMPYRDEVLDVLDNTPVWIFDARNRVVGGRKQRLMDLRGGEPYRYMLREFFPDLRSSVVLTLYVREPERTGNGLQQGEPGKIADGEPTSADSLRTMPEIPDTTQTTPPLQPEEITDPIGPPAVSGNIPQESYGPIDRADVPFHRLALKTNLLYDAALMPSLEVEYLINERWTVNLEGEVAWWSKKSKHKYYQIATISPEARYWFKTRKPWHGHYVGLFAGGSWYDLENGKRGYKGELIMAGLSYGYMFPVSRNLSFEAGIGLGFLHTSYEEYLPIDGHYVYQRTSRTDYFGPVKLKFALVWRLWNQNRKGGAR